ncbi:methyltransferase domain-containing protein [Kribbella solani]|uniref:SAM-dependent methyltransferase n=1 Tax=Kribbella solani TaxID=236067 RepID=A0A841E563_9ACTN|nr:SAM-dependent methyltransferase [Kribbella solani]
MRYYYAEHEDAYRRLRERGMRQWSALFEAEWGGGVDAFPNREFLERALSRLSLGEPRDVDVLEYGCGTGPAACFLAGLGYRVEAVDLIPDAIEVAREIARELGVEVEFAVRDMCALAGEPVRKQYDLVLDGYCLQSIVIDADRAALFAAVRERLKGYYVISTAMYAPDREYEEGFWYDAETGICYQAGAAGDATIERDGVWYRPHRRHLRPEALHTELEAAGFHIITQEGNGGGDVICTRA